MDLIEVDEVCARRRCLGRIGRMKDILVPVSPGELLDKITIPRIKSARMTDPAKLANVRVELEALERTWRDSGAAGRSRRSPATRPRCSGSTRRCAGHRGPDPRQELAS